MQSFHFLKKESADFLFYAMSADVRKLFKTHANQMQTKIGTKKLSNSLAS